MKAYRLLPIEESHEPLAPIPEEQFKLWDPHPYLTANAPYHGVSPWQLRSGVLEALIKAQALLPRGTRFLVFDAYRPIGVQSHMVQLEFLSLSGGTPPERLEEAHKRALLEKTYRIWAEPSDDPKTPPPHSTGAAIDLTLANDAGIALDLGSPIDENSDRSLPDYFEDKAPEIHQRRCVLLNAMQEAGFCRHPEEWWHFSLGDQLWAFETAKTRGSVPKAARYGRGDLILP